MTLSPKQRWSAPRKVVWWIFVGCLALLSLFFFLMALYEFKLTGRVNLDPVFHAIICSAAALGFFKIQQHPEWILDSEGKTRPLFRR